MTNAAQNSRFLWRGVGAVVGLLVFFALVLALQRLPERYSTLLYAVLIVSGFTLLS